MDRFALSADQQSARAGDDIAQARLFCVKAGSGFDAITDDQGQPSRDIHHLCAHLTDIQRGAKRARARSVYRGAQDVLNLIQRPSALDRIDWARVDARLFVLTKLMDQYESGVSEIERQLDITPPTDPEMITSETSDHMAARDKLTSLLPHASSDERAALERLMDVQLEPVGDVLKAEPMVESGESLDSLMPDLVQRLIGVGHQFGKSVSVSYAVDEVIIPDAHVESLKGELYEQLSDRISGPMPLQGIGHLDICAKDEGLLISGSGFSPFEMTLPGPNDAPPAPAPKRLITEDTEADLRAQLAALLDGGL